MVTSVRVNFQRAERSPAIRMMTLFRSGSVLAAHIVASNARAAPNIVTVQLGSWSLVKRESSSELDLVPRLDCARFEQVELWEGGQVFFTFLGAQPPLVDLVSIASVDSVHDIKASGDLANRHLPWRLSQSR